MKLATEKQIGFATKLIDIVTAGADSVPESLESIVTERIETVTPTIIKVKTGEDVPAFEVSKLIDALVFVRDVLPKETKPVTGVRWTKLGNEFVLYGPSTLMKSGEWVTVTKADGSEPKEIVGQIIKTEEGVTYAYPQKINGDLTPGLYRTGEGELREVKLTRNGQLVGYSIDNETAERDYLGKAGLRGLTLDNQLSESEAQEFGKRTGTCVCCGRELTNEESRNLGIGPVCREKMFGL